MAKKTNEAADQSTELKIKAAAIKVFTQKGFAATRTRDIAEEAGINLALLNYYFRSKEKLFDMVMTENIQKLLTGIGEILNDVNTPLIEKVNRVTSHYIDLLKTHADLPLFVLTEMRTNPVGFAVDQDTRDMMLQSNFYKQLEATTKQQIDPVHFIMNILGLAVFPFVAGPLFKAIGEDVENGFDQLMEERKRMIPLWIDAMLKVS